MSTCYIWWKAQQSQHASYPVIGVTMASAVSKIFSWKYICRHLQASFFAEQNNEQTMALRCPCIRCVRMYVDVADGGWPTGDAAR